MSERFVSLQPGFLIRHWPYGETSLLADVLTRDFGRISLLARGLRKPKSKLAGVLMPFVPLLLSYGAGRGELHYLSHAEHQHSVFDSPLQGKALFCGFYINELITHFLHQSDPHPEVFELYQQSLMSLQNGAEVESCLRCFEVNLLELVGYGLDIRYDSQTHQLVEADRKYHFSVEQGPRESVNGEINGTTLQALHSRQFKDKESLLQAKKIMRMVIDFHLQGKLLKSRETIAKIIKHM
ncbi:MAG: DNA repair protein RecO [Methylicorpusculum sp.]|uniref:DNA repair protein RecO n=1 Tax=Methylicorpusculum sp. TaxID=2713644 RepID=UPI00271DEAD5|nr:DNA repair protein RecO [Methylicorpusculum sp.]MDO8938961.1 DNA repair protein RecO [Methylicorpusculum sp.]MDP2200495.1 DNA repair protein RecO [Methylicorpusculum sp.]